MRARGLGAVRAWGRAELGREVPKALDQVQVSARGRAYPWVVALAPLVLFALLDIECCRAAVLWTVPAVEAVEDVAGLEVGAL